jgi:hypothetical protein
MSHDTALGDRVDYTIIGTSAVLSASGWLAIDRWLPVTHDGAYPIVVAFMRTVLMLIPPIIAFVIAGRRQRRTHKLISMKLAQIREGMSELERLRKIEHEIHTMDRLSRVAREAVKHTASGARELLGAIEGVDDDRMKERLVERYRTYTNNVVTVLSAVNEQMEESGRSIYREISADDSIHVLQREKDNTSKGVEYAKEIMQQRGILDGVAQVTFAAEQAAKLQHELTSLKAIASPEGENHGRQ